jgi:hypothetical protein
MIGRGRVQILSRGEAALAKLLGTAHVVVRGPAHRHQHDPLPRRCRRRLSTHDVHDLRDRAEIGDRNAAPRAEPFAVGMRVRVEEAGQHRTAAHVDPPRVRTGVAQERETRPHRRDATPAHGDGLGHSRGTIECQDGPAVQDDVGRARIRSHPSLILR